MMQTNSESPDKIQDRANQLLAVGTGRGSLTPIEAEVWLVHPAVMSGKKANLLGGSHLTNMSQSDQS